MQQAPTFETAFPPVGNMNLLHHWLCRSDYWRKTVQQRVPWAVAGRALGPRVLELGPGPGLTTDLLHSSITHLTALELDPILAQSLRTRFAISNVDVVTGDATAIPFPNKYFSAAVCFTMLHHIPSPELQDKLLGEVWRVVRPGGIFVGSDSLQSWIMRTIHIGDTLVPIEPITFGARLTAAGFEGVIVEKNSDAFRFYARRPLTGPSECNQEILERYMSHQT